MFNIRVLKALGGDCIIIAYGQEQIHYVLIDGGCGKLCLRQLSSIMEDIKKKENCELSAIILTHIDSDHIDGILKLLSGKDFNYFMIKQIWINYGKKLQDSLGLYETETKKIFLYSQDTKISWKQANDLEKILLSENVPVKTFIKTGDTYFIDDAEINILSPDNQTLKELLVKGIEAEKSTCKISGKSDYNKSIDELCAKELEGVITLTNKSSMAFIFNYEEKKILFLGDADAAIVQEALINLGYSKNNKIKIDYCKIAHHASKHNTSNELIQMLNCTNYIISTHQTMQGRPSKECLSRIICNSDSKVTFYCNYNIEPKKIFTESEYKKYGMKFVVMDDTGINLEEI